jgi:Tfp pilus assembly protein PilP
MKLAEDDHVARKGAALAGRTLIRLGLALALAAWCAFGPGPAFAQTLTPTPMDLNVEVGSDGGQPPAPASALPSSGMPSSGMPYSQPETGFTTQPPAGSLPGQDPTGSSASPYPVPMEAPASEPLPIVPADAPPPVPPSLSAKPAAEPEPEPATPEEAAALELKNKTIAELTTWHDGVMQNYAFSTGLMSDPFMPIESVARPPETALDTQQDEERRRRLPLLQRLALNQFTLSAIVVSANPEATSALLDGGGRSFIVHRGTLIGPNGGYVKEITPSRVIVVEPQVNYRGETQMAETVFRMNILEDESLEDFKLEHGLDG